MDIDIVDVETIDLKVSIGVVSVQSSGIQVGVIEAVNFSISLPLIWDETFWN